MQRLLHGFLLLLLPLLFAQQPLAVGFLSDQFYPVMQSHSQSLASYLEQHMLEGLDQQIQHHQLKPDQLKIINPQQFQGYSVSLSSRLYPNWPFVALPDQASSIRGFSITMDDRHMENTMREMRLPPIDNAPAFTWRDAWEMYRTAIVAAAVAMMVIVLLMFRLVTSNRTVQRTLDRLDEQKYALNQHAMVSITDLEGTITHANDKFTEISGYSVEELLGQNHRILNSGYHDKSFFCDMFNTITAGQVWHGEICNKTKDGHLYWVDSTIVPFPGVDGKLHDYIALYNDISKHKKSEQVLRVSENRYRSLVQSIPGTTYICAMDKRWTMEFVSDEVENLTGYPGSDFYRNQVRSFASIIHPEDMQRVEDIIQHSVESKKPYIIEYRIVHADNELRWVFEKGHGVFDASGQLQYLEGVLIDITERKRAEEELRVQEENLRTILNSIGDGVIATDIKDGITHMNPVAEKLTGWTFKDTRGKPLTEVFKIVNAQTKEVAVNPVSKVLEKGEIVDLANHTMLIARDGAEHQIADSASPIKDAEGNITGVVLVFRDITEKYQLEQTLLESNERLQGALEASRSGTWRVDLHTGFDTRDASLNKMLGLPAEPSTQPVDDWFTYVHPDDMETMKVAWEQGLESGLYSMEHRLVRNDGQILWVYDRGLMVRDEEGQLLYAIGAVIDITERKLAEEALQKNEKLLNAVAENFPNSYVSIIEEDFTVCFSSGQEFKKQNLDPEQFMGRNLEEIFDEDAAIIRPYYEKTFNGEECAFELFHNQKYQFYRTVPLRSEDGTIHQILVVIENITERKQAENALRRAQKMDAIGQLTGGVAHDFNNILGIIIGNLDLVKMRELRDNNAQNWINEAYKAALRATDLTKKLLSFSRRRAEKAIITDINDVIKDMDNLIARSLTPEVTINYLLVDDVWSTNIDPGDLEDALLNLVINARDAMPGGGRLTIETSNTLFDENYCSINAGATPGEYVQLTVSDNGTGISPEQLDRIFDPFFTTKTQGKGTGLGLSMVFGFVKRSGGYIKVYSEVGIGTTIRLYLPRAQGQTEQATQHAALTDALPHGHETVLVIDDEEGLLDLAEESLRSLGYRVIAATNGKQALEKLAAEPDVALLFSDVVMPGGMNGYELAEQATFTRPNLKVLLTSGYTEKAATINHQARFNTNLLSKPYTQAELAHRVRKVLGDTQSSHSEQNTDISAIVWSEAFSTGIKAIDDDHKVLMALFNRCRDASDRGAEADDRVKTILAELQHYTATHFRREESIMKACDYPQLENHAQVHQLLIKQVEQKRKQLEQGELATYELLQFLRGWLVEHILSMDMAFVPSCQGKEALIEQSLAQAGPGPGART